MNSGQWILFLIQFISASYLIILNIAILYYILVIFAILKARGSDGPNNRAEKWPHISVMVPCFMPNEQHIIEETLERVCGVTQYDGIMDVIVPYNTPKPLDIEKKLQKMTSLHGRKLTCVNVEGSTSKAHNLDHALETLVDDAAEIVVIFDADHHVRADTVATLVSTLIHPDSKHLSRAKALY